MKVFQKNATSVYWPTFISIVSLFLLWRSLSKQKTLID